MRRFPIRLRLSRAALAAALTLGPLAALAHSDPAVAQVPGSGVAADSMSADSVDHRTIIYLVRHGEVKIDSSAEMMDRNPPLSAAGRRRARWLAILLSHARLNAVYTTRYVRTRNTAAPTAAEAHLEPIVYDPSDLHGLARTLREEGGHALVVGHSNTTPALVAALGGDPGPPIEEWEYGRFYTVIIDGPSVRTVMLRY